jgi:hypothetical protein
VIEPGEAPGFPEALAIITQVGGVLLSQEAAVRLAIAAVAAAGPAIRAEVLADLSDDLRDAATEWSAHGREAWTAVQALELFAHHLDQASHDVREALA